MTPAVTNWAIRHRVSAQALHELAAIFGLHGDHTMTAEVTGVSESAVQAAVRLEAARLGIRLWRNNVGALVDFRGVPVRYGLANDSKEINAKLKSGDLIGVRPVLIEPRHVGTVIGQFVSREVKRVGWHYTGANREPAQLAWAQLVTAMGGDAQFCTGVGTL